MPDAYERVVALARRQDDMVTRGEARRLGLSEAAIAARRRVGGWRSPIRGALVVPPVRDRVRAYARAALAVAGGVVCLLTAARLHRLPGLPPWAAGEPVDVAFADPAVAGRRRAGCRRHVLPVAPAQLTDLGGIVVTTPQRTLQDIVLRLERGVSIPVLRAVRRLGGEPGVNGAQSDTASPRLGMAEGGLAEASFLALKEAILRRNDSGDGPGGDPEFWQALEGTQGSGAAAGGGR